MIGGIAMDRRSSNNIRLARIAKICRKARRGSSHPRYPQEVKQQVQDLLKGGVTASVISESTGLSNSVIRKWSKSQIQNPESIKVLPVVDDRGWSGGPGKPVLMLKTGEVEIAIFSRRNS